MRGEGGDFIEKVQFPPVLFVARFRLLLFLSGFGGCLFHNARIFWGALWLRGLVLVSHKFAHQVW